MTDEPSIKTKTDILDLMISFLVEHEKQMDEMLQRLEGIVEKLSVKGRRIEGGPASPPSGERPGSFTVSVTNPGNFEHIRSLSIEWGTKGDPIPRTGETT